MRSIIFLGLIFFLVTGLFAQKINIVNNPFDDDRFTLVNKKKLISTDSTLYYTEKGYFNFENKHYFNSTYRWYFHNYGMSSTAITQYKADVIQLSGVQNYGYGIVVNALDGNNNVIFTIASSGYYSIQSFNNGVVNKISNGWVKSTLVKTGLNASNQLAIERNGDEYSFFLNGVAVKQVKLVGQKFVANLGLTAQGGMHVAMDNVEIQQWVSDNILAGKIGPGYTPITTYPIAVKPIPTKTKKTELYVISLGTYQYGLKDKDGYRLIDPIHSSLDYQNGFIKVGSGKTNNFGIFDEKGNVIVPQVMQSVNIHQSKEGVYFICRAENGFYGLINQVGKTVLPFVYNYIDQVAEGLVYAKTNKGWGVVDLTGLPVIAFGNLEDEDERKNSTYRRTKQFFNGRMMTIAKVSDGGKMGIIDTKGNWVILPKYESISRVDTNRSYITAVISPTNKRRMKYGVIDYNGVEIIPHIYSSISTASKNYIVADGVDPYGYDLISLSNQSSWNATDSKQDVNERRERKWGMLGSTGSVIIPVKHDYIFSTSDKQTVRVGDYGSSADKIAKETQVLYDINGKVLFSFDSYDAYINDSTKLKNKLKTDYRNVYPDYTDGLINVTKAGKWGFVDRIGKVVIPFQYDYATSFDRGAALVKKGDEWFYINKLGKKITEAEANPVSGIDYKNKEMPPIRPMN